jgi:hypothetical protein
MISEIDIFNGASKVDLADFGREFSKFQSTAKRLEMLPRYHVPSEAEAIERFGRGDQPPVSFNSEWHATIAEAGTRGAQVSRVRGLPREISDYLRFEIAWGYTGGVAAGEGIRFLFTDEIERLAGPLVPIPDVWVFDNERAYVMHYDFRGAFYGALRTTQPAATELAALIAILEVQARDWDWVRRDYVRIYD